jgi:hypothetical protein
MLRTLLAIAVVLLALPALLAAQRPGTPRSGAAHGRATQFLGEVVRPAADAVRTAGGINHNQSNGDKAEDQKDAQEGPDVDENHDGHEGQETDVDDGPNGNEGPDVDEGPKGKAQSQGDGDKEDGPDNPPPAPGQNRVGRHKP